jgi:transcriptional regulator with GAF, ATPase, and Fis domain
LGIAWESQYFGNENTSYCAFHTMPIPHIIHDEDKNMLPEDAQKLASLNAALSSIGSRDELFDVLITQIKPVFGFDIAIVGMVEQTPANAAITSIGDKRAQVFAHLLLPEMLRTDLIQRFTRRKIKIGGTPFEALLMLTEPVIITPEFVEQHYSFGPLQILRRIAGIKHIMAAPLRCGDEVVGFMNIASKREGHFQERDLQLYKQVTERAALALRAVFAMEELRLRTDEAALQRRLHGALVHQRSRHVLATESFTLEQFTLALADAIDTALPCSVIGLIISDADANTAVFGSAVFSSVVSRAAVWLQKDTVGKWGVVGIAAPAPHSLHQNTQSAQGVQSVLYLGEEFQTMCDEEPLARVLHEELDAESLVAVPIALPPGTYSRQGSQGLLLLAERQPYGFTEDDAEMLERLTPQITLGLLGVAIGEGNHEENKTSSNAASNQAAYALTLKQPSQYVLPEMIGVSSALCEVASAVRQVAPTQATVLVAGETGTGKERIARAVHTLSTRATKPFVTLNCAALPPQLMESELFGHEKGAFTGAVARRIGKFEQADGGTLFLDEIGELPLELQAKLLRALQEREIERLGGKDIIKLDVRVVAATNRDLQAEVAASRFRADLYYRLNVFPILVPPLRERREDVRVLAEHFAHKAALQLGKEIHSIEETSMQAMMRYSWPGNIRELENVVERAVIVATTPVLTISSLLPTETHQGWSAKIKEEVEKDVRIETSKEEASGQSILPHLRSLDDAERAHILAVLNETGWRVSGERGAAKILKMKPTTLEYRMKKLGIQRGMTMDS